MINYFKKISYYFIILFVVYIPFYRFFQALLESHTLFSDRMVFWTTHWYEPVFLVLAISVLLSKLLVNRKLSWVQIIASLLILFGIISSFFISPTVGRGFEGFRLSIFPLVVFLLALEIGFAEREKKVILNAYLVTVTIIAIWAIIERFLPSGYWTIWGVLRDNTYWYGFHKAGEYVQSVSLVGGPNQLASYLLPAVFLPIAGLREKTRNKNISLAVALLSLIVIVIFLTFSRSAILGLTVGLFFLLWALLKSSILRKITIVVALFVVALLSYFYLKNPSFEEFLNHGSSQSQHQAAMEMTFTELQHRFSTHSSSFWLGGGLGTAGPIAIKYQDGIVSESWYLEVILELGAVGLMLYLAFFAIILKNSCRGGKVYFYILISVLTTTAFLHTLSDNPALTLPLFIFMAFLKVDQGEKNEK